MRSLLFFCGCLLFTVTLSAQYERGNWYLSAGSETSSAGLRQPLTLNDAGVGYFVRDRFLLGIRASAGYFNEDFEGGNARINPYARYYLPSKKQNLSYFAELGGKLGYGYRGDHSLTAAVGLEYQVVPGVMFTASLNYKTANKYAPQSLGLDMGLNVILGERYEPEGKYDFLHRKGTLMLNGTIGNLSLNGTVGDLTLGGKIDLGAAYFLSERFLVEGAFSYSSGVVEIGLSELPRRAYITRINASVGGRYFFLPGKRFQPYIGMGLSLENERFRDVSPTGPNNSGGNPSDFFANAKAGFLYHLNDRVAIDFHLNYRKNLERYSTDQDQLTGGIGVKVFLGKKQ